MQKKYGRRAHGISMPLACIIRYSKVCFYDLEILKLKLSLFKINDDWASYAMIIKFISLSESKTPQSK